MRALTHEGHYVGSVRVCMEMSSIRRMIQDKREKKNKKRGEKMSEEDGCVEKMLLYSLFVLTNEIVYIKNRKRIYANCVHVFTVCNGKTPSLLTFVLQRTYEKGYSRACKAL